MKKIIDEIILKLSHKHPYLWLELNEWLFDEIDDFKKEIFKKIKK